MNILKLARTFTNDESGAVTVDWVVLTAAIVGLGIAVLATVTSGVNTMGTNIAGTLDNAGMIGAGTGATIPTN